MKKIAVCMAIFLSLLFFCFGCGSKPHEGFLLSVTTLELKGGQVKQAEREIKSFLSELENQVGLNVQSSDLSRINHAEAGQAVSVGKDTEAIYALATRYCELTETCFNPAIYPLVQLWGFDTGNFRVPTAEEIEKTKVLCDLSLFCLENGKMTKSQAGAGLDFGGIAKGYAANECVRIAKKHGVTSGIINIGGNLYLMGAKENGSPFRVGIRDPRKLENKNSGYFGVTEVKNTSVVTSGDYENFYMENGIRYCHILDTKSGRPSQNGLISVTVMNEDSAFMDACSTALFVMGKERALAFAQENGLKILLIDESKQYVTTMPIYDIFSAYVEYIV